jgi:hypothetical protein
MVAQTREKKSMEYVFAVVFYYAIIGVPVLLILRRLGLNPWGSLLVLVPIVNLISLWVFANMRWPALDGVPRAQSTPSASPRP